MDTGRDRQASPVLNQPRRLENAYWPSRAQELIDTCYALCAQALHEPLRHCLDTAGQELFALAERARLPAEQQDCMVTRQRLLHERDTIERHFLDKLATGLLGLGAPKPAVESTRDTTWGSLELVDPAEQELAMAIDRLGARGDVRHSAVLQELGYRFAVLIASPPLEAEALAMGPLALARAFSQTLGEIELPLEHHLRLLRHFEATLQTLGTMYQQVNHHLQTAGILPGLKGNPMPRSVDKRSRANTHAEDREPAHDDTAAAPLPDVAPAAGGDHSIAVLESLRDLLAQQRANQATATHPAGRAASADELQLALGALQQHLAQVTDQASRELRSAQRLRDELLTQLNLNRPQGSPPTHLTSEQGDTVELVAMLFEQLGQQLQQGSSAKALLGDLQLPVLRVAVTDQNFFEQQEHPARRLLETVTTTANDWLDGSDDATSRTLATKLEQLVNRANREPPSAGLFTTLLADIEHHLAQLTRKAQAAERRHVEAVQGRERLDQARQRAAALMAERFAESPPRGLLRALLDRAWTDVLALNLLRHGEGSPTFQTHLAITDQLLGRLPFTNHKQLQRDIEAGLQQIGMHTEEAEQVAQRLLGLGDAETQATLPSATDLAARLRLHRRLGETAAAAAPTAPPVPATPPAAPPPATTTTEPVPSAPPATPVQVRAMDTTTLPTPPSSAPAKAAAVNTTATAAIPPVKAAMEGGQASPPSARPAANTAPVPAPPPSARELDVEKQLRKLSFGTWFTFVDPKGGPPVQRKLAWYSTMSGRCLLLNRRGQRCEELTLLEFAREIAAGRASQVEERPESMLDRAWNSLTRNLRQSGSATRHASEGGRQ